MYKKVIGLQKFEDIAETQPIQPCLEKLQKEKRSGGQLRPNRCTPYRNTESRKRNKK